MKLFDRIELEWLHSRKVRQMLLELYAKLAAKDSELDQLRFELRQAQDEAQRVADDHRAELERTTAELARITAELRAITGQESLGATIGTVRAWAATAQGAPALWRENAVLRQQLNSVALSGMHQIDMLRYPVTDKAPPKPSDN